jgi:hypothetical protein
MVRRRHNDGGLTRALPLDPSSKERHNHDNSQTDCQILRTFFINGTHISSFATPSTPKCAGEGEGFDGNWSGTRRYSCHLQVVLYKSRVALNGQAARAAYYANCTIALTFMPTPYSTLLELSTRRSSEYKLRSTGRQARLGQNTYPPRVLCALHGRAIWKLLSATRY